MPSNPVIPNPWNALRQFTDARIALGRAGVSVPTQAHLAFQLAHANARDAVHHALDAERLARSLDAALTHVPSPCLTLHSAAEDRMRYLQRPDFGRRLSAASRDHLATLNRPQNATPRSGSGNDSTSASASAAELRPYDLALVVVDGLSALAIEKNALPFVNALWSRLSSDRWSLAPVSVVQHGRVAIGDEVGQMLGAKAVVVLIGERPGLSSPDSMGLYMTWMPQVGLTDASRNCISNVRPAGVQYEEAAYKLHYLLAQSRLRQLSGVGLKDETGGAALQGAGDGTGIAARRSFLVGPGPVSES